MPFKRIHLAECSSTNLLASEMYCRGEDITNTIISTDYQTSGKGLDANSWHSEKQKNLLFSLVIKPEYLEVTQQFMLTKAVSLGMHDALSEVLPGEVLRIKWPNDIYVGDRKICGILISNIIAGSEFIRSIIGIGLNVNQMAFPFTLPNPVSIKQISGRNTDRDRLLDKLGTRLALRLNALSQQGGKGINQDYLHALYRYQEWCNYESEGYQFSARILKVDDFGHLVLELESGVVKSFDLKALIFK